MALPYHQPLRVDLYRFLFKTIFQRIQRTKVGKLRNSKCESPQLDREVISVRRIDGPESLLLEGSTFGHGLRMLVDNGVSSTIVWADTSEYVENATAREEAVTDGVFSM